MTRMMCLILLTFMGTTNSKAQDWWGSFLMGVGQGVQNALRQQQYQRQVEERQRQVEERRKKEQLANQIHDTKKVEKNGFEWTEFYKGEIPEYYGAKNKYGRAIIPLSRKYKFIYFHEEDDCIGYFSVEKDGKYGVCDLTGKEIIPCIYSSVFYSRSEGNFVYKGSDGEYHNLDIALNSAGKGCKPDPERLIAKIKQTEEDGYIWYSTKDKGKQGLSNNGARSIDGKVIVPNNYFSVKYMNGYFIAEQEGSYFSTLYQKDGTCLLPNSRQYGILEVHPDEGWAKVYRNSPKGKLAGAIDLHTAKEIVPMRPFCFIRYNKVSKRFETKANKKSAWVKTACTLDIRGGNISSSSRSTVSRTQRNKSAKSNPVTYHYTKSGRGQSQNTGQWTNSSGPEECDVEFGDNGITINGIYYDYVRTSGIWKVYGGTSLGFGGTSSTFYYYVDPNKNMKCVCEYFGSYGGGDTFIYPMSRNGDPTPQGINDNTYGSGSSSSSVGTKGDSSSSVNSSSSRKKLSNCPSLTINNYCCPVKIMKRFKNNISPDSRYIWYTYEPF